VDGTVYVGSLNGRFLALDGASGAIKWEFEANTYGYSSPAIGLDGTVFVGSGAGRVYAFDGATGVKKWEFIPAGRVFSSPAIGADGTIYFGSTENRLYALDGATGAKKWEFLAGAAVNAPPSIAADGTVYVAADDFKVYALEAATGEKKWEFRTDYWIESCPAIGADGTVFVLGWDGSLYALAGTSPLARTPWPKFRGGSLNSGRSLASPAPLPRLEVVGFSASGSILKGQVTAGRKYLLQASDDLMNWTTLTLLTNATGKIEFNDGQAMGLARRFYRLQAEAPSIP
jgi:outer membrane protein assembly factor BamB